MASAQSRHNGTVEFEAGDAVVHPHQGAGTVADIVTIPLGDQARDYYRIELISGNGMLMIPTDEIENLGVRYARYSTDDLRKVLMQEPTELQDHYRSRQANIRDQLASGSPRKIAAALRDLAWREREDDLTKVDRDLKREAKSRLIEEIAAQGNIALSTAKKRLNKLLDTALESHAAN